MRNYAVIPNQLILDSRLRPSTRRVAVTLYAYRGRDNVLCKSMKVLTKLCHCCRKTLLQALEQLEELRYLKRRHRCRWSQRLKRPIYKANRYYLHVDLSQGYTLMPRRHPAHRRHSHTVFRLPAPHGPLGSEQPQLSVSPADLGNPVDCKIYRLSGRCCAGTRAVYRQESLSHPDGLLFV